MLEWAALSVGLLAVYTYRADFEKYSIFTTGVFKRVSREVVETEHECHDTHCEATVSPGERRRWYKEIVVGGMPAIRFGGGAHYYCENHVAFEIRNDLNDPRRSTVERLAMPIAEAIVAFAEWKVEPPETEDSPLTDAQTNVTASMSSAVSLVPVLLLVLVCALVIGAVKNYQKSLV